MATNEEIQGELSNPEMVAIKSEPGCVVVDIKMEPPDGSGDSNEYEDTSASVENGNAQIVEKEAGAQINVEKEATSQIIVVNKADVRIKVEEGYGVENITVKVEPTYYSSDDELDLASYQNLMSQEYCKSQDNAILRIPQLNKRKKRDQDEEYVPKKKKKKVIKEIVKKTYTTKRKSIGRGEARL